MCHFLKYYYWYFLNWASAADSGVQRSFSISISTFQKIFLILIRTIQYSRAHCVQWMAAVLAFEGKLKSRCTKWQVSSDATKILYKLSTLWRNCQIYFDLKIDHQLANYESSGFLKPNKIFCFGQIVSKYLYWERKSKINMYFWYMFRPLYYIHLLLYTQIIL